MPIAQDLKQPVLPNYVELFVLDISGRGGPVLYLTPNTVAGASSISFDGNVYTAIPISGSGWETSIDGKSPQPLLKISNVNKFVQSYLTTYKDLVGCRLTRYQTFEKYLDAASFIRRNVFNHSEALDNAYWTKTRATISANVATAPNGTTTADKLVEDATATNSHFMQVGGSSVPVVSGQQYTLSFYAKAAERQFMSVELGAAGLFGGVLQRRDVLLSTGANSTFNSGTSTCTSTDVGNGWYRYVMTTPAVTTSGNNVVSFLLKNADTSSRNYTGDGASGCLIWGVQWEVGATASEYQYTAANHHPTTDPTQVFNTSVYEIQQKTQQDKNQIEFLLSSIIDLPQVRLPRQQVLRKTFPGAGLFRKS